MGRADTLETARTSMLELFRFFDGLSSILQYSAVRGKPPSFKHGMQRSPSDRTPVKAIWLFNLLFAHHFQRSKENGQSASDFTMGLCHSVVI